MPLYYFNIYDHGHRLIKDEEGIELADDRAAQAEATRGVRDLAANAIREGRPLARRLEVRNEAGEPLLSLSVLSVIQ